MKVLTFLPRFDLQRRVAKALCSAQFVMETAASAKECLQFAQFAQFEGVLVDSDSLIFADALALVRLLRQENSDASLFVFARYLDLEQRLRLFEAGIDDCVREPFYASELAVRLGLSIRLRQAASDTVAFNAGSMLRSGDLELDLMRRRAARLGKAIDLRPREFLLLEYLVRNVNRPVTRTMILEHVWNSSFEGLTNVVDVYISALRSKVDRDFPHKLIQTNRGIGYTLICATSVPEHQIAAQAHHANGFPVASVGTGALDKRRVLKGRGFTHAERLGQGETALAVLRKRSAEHAATSTKGQQASSDRPDF
jgi:two-component system OmpR family response regulator